MAKTYLPKDRNLKKEHLEGLIHFARKIKTTGVNKMDFQVFDTTKMDEYTKKAKEQWGQTPEYKEFEEKTQSQSPDTQKVVWQNLMLIFAAKAIEIYCK